MMVVFHKLTRPDGKPIYISQAGVVIDPVIETMPGRTRIMIDGVAHYVAETVAEVLKCLELDELT